MADSPDWPAIKRAYLNGEGSYRELAKRFNVNWHTLAKHGNKEDWSNTAKERQLNEIVSQELAIEGRRIAMSTSSFLKRSIFETETWLDRIEKLASEGLDVDKLSTLVGAWRNTIGVGRQTFRLDQDQSSSQVHRAQQLTEVIDVEVEDAGIEPTSLEQKQPDSASTVPVPPIS